MGVGLGVFLRGVLRPLKTPLPAPSPPAITRPLVPPLPVVMVEDRDVDVAVRKALRRIGSMHEAAAHDTSALQDGRQIRWHMRTMEVRLSGRLEEAVAVLGKEVEGAGGKVISRSSSVVRVGLVYDGLPLITHEVRFVLIRPQAKVAIIFDDAGGSLTDLEAIIDLGRPVAVAVLPGLRHSREVALLARAAGLEVFLHLPVEPEDATKALGPGGITTAMTDEEIVQTVRDDLAWVPGAVGVNNHMGSRGTADARVMRAVLQVVKERSLIFVDSVTSSRSIAARVAAEMRIPRAARQVFLDNENDASYIRQQVRRLVALARQRGEAVAIGHVQRMTGRVLKEMLAEFDRQGVEIVPVSTLVR